MKYLKMLGLVAVAVVATLAFAGAGTASADEICTEPAIGNDGQPVTTMCPEGKKIMNLELSLVGTAKTEDTSHNVLSTCTGGTMQIAGLNAVNGNETGSESVTGTVAAAGLTWTGCTINVGTIKGGTVHLTHAPGGGTTVTGTEWQVTKKVPIIGTCVYSAAPLLTSGRSPREATH